MQKNIIIILILSIFIAIFAILNAGAVPVNLIVTTVEISAALVILISACFGAVIVFVFDTMTKRKLRKVIKEHEKNIVLITKEHQDLKAKYDDAVSELSVLKDQINVVNENLELNVIEEQ